MKSLKNNYEMIVIILFESVSKEIQNAFDEIKRY